MSSDVSWHIRDKLWPVPKHGSINLYRRPRKPEGSLERTAQEVHLDSHTAPELLVDWLMIAYIALSIFRSLEQTHCPCMWFYMPEWLAISRFEYPPKLMPHETAAISAQVLCTPYNHAPCHFMQSHIRKAYACLAVTCHLHFRQNDRDLLRATAVTLTGWNGYQNKS